MSSGPIIQCPFVCALSCSRATHAVEYRPGTGANRPSRSDSLHALSVQVGCHDFLRLARLRLLRSPTCMSMSFSFFVAQIEAGLQRRLTLALALLAEGVTCDPNARVVDERLLSPDSETAPVEKRATVMFVYHRGFRVLSTL